MRKDPSLAFIRWKSTLARNTFAADLIGRARFEKSKGTTILWRGPFEWEDETDFSLLAPFLDLPLTGYPQISRKTDRDPRSELSLEMDQLFVALCLSVICFFPSPASVAGDGYSAAIPLYLSTLENPLSHRQ